MPLTRSGAYRGTVNKYRAEAVVTELVAAATARMGTMNGQGNRAETDRWLEAIRQAEHLTGHSVNAFAPAPAAAPAASARRPGWLPALGLRTAFLMTLIPCVLTAAVIISAGGVAGWCAWLWTGRSREYLLDAGMSVLAVPFLLRDAGALPRAG